MKLFSKNGFPRKVLFIELILLASLACAYLGTAYLKHSGILPDPQWDKPVRDYKNLVANYRVLNHFLHLPTSTFTPPNNDEIPPNDSQEPLPPLVEQVRKLQEVESLLKERKYSRATATLSSIEKPHHFIKKKMNKFKLQLLYFNRRYGEFIQQYTMHPENNLQVKLLLINCLLKTGEEKKAFKQFKKMFMTRSLEPFQKTLGTANLKKLLAQLQYDDWSDKYYFLVGRNYYTEYLREKQYIRSPQLHSLIQAEFHYRRKQYSAAQRQLRGVDHPKLRWEKEKILIKIDIRRKQYDDILPRLDKLKIQPRLYMQVLFDAASIALINRNAELSLALYSRYIRFVEQQPKYKKNNSDYWKGLWVSAWLSYRQNNKKDTLLFLQKGTISPGDSYRMAFLYWYYRLQERELRPVEKYPFSYYYTKTSEAAAGGSPQRLEPFIKLINGFQGSFFNQFLGDLKTLLRHRLIDEAFEYTRWAQTHNFLNDSERNVFKLIESIMYLRSGKFYHAFVSFRKNFECYQCLRLPRFLGRIYSPLRYTDLVDVYSDRNQVDKFLVLALIREESFFRPNIISPAHANGLMQLILPTAKIVANQEGMGRIRRYDLYKPGTNIRLGTAHLKELMDKYKNKPHLVLAAYNAGAHRVDAWLEDFGDMPDDVFIEMIPFTETRNYVKNILRNYYYYKYYHGGRL